MFKKKIITILLSAFIIISSLGLSQNAVNAISVNGWLKNGTTWNYYVNGTIKTGWQFDEGQWYYLNIDGSMATGWKQVGGYWYYLNPSGDMAANKWVGNYYLGASGAMLVSTVTPDGYAVGADGAWDGETKVNITKFFPLLSDVPMPASINYYKTSLSADNTIIFYYYSSLSLPNDTYNFFDEYFLSFFNNGWALYKSETDTYGNNITSFVKGNNLVLIRWIGNDLVIEGPIH